METMNKIYFFLFSLSLAFKYKTNEIAEDNNDIIIGKTLAYAMQSIAKQLETAKTEKRKEIFDLFVLQ